MYRITKDNVTCITLTNINSVVRYLNEVTKGQVLSAYAMGYRVRGV